MHNVSIAVEQFQDRCLEMWQWPEVAMWIREKLDIRYAVLDRICETYQLNGGLIRHMDFQMLKQILKFENTKRTLQHLDNEDLEEFISLIGQRDTMNLVRRNYTKLWRTVVKLGNSHFYFSQTQSGVFLLF